MKKAAERGTQDELEVLKQVIEADPILRESVLEKIRQLRALSRQTVFDVVKEKEDAKTASMNAQRRNMVK